VAVEGKLAWALGLRAGEFPPDATIFAIRTGAQLGEKAGLRKKRACR